LRAGLWRHGETLFEMVRRAPKLHCPQPRRELRRAPHAPWKLHKSYGFGWRARHPYIPDISCNSQKAVSWAALARARGLSPRT